MLIFDCQLTELSCESSTVSADILIATSLILLYKEKLINWRDDPFERVIFLRNLPKITSVDEVIACARSLKTTKNGKDVIIVQLWVIFIILLYIAENLTS